MEYERVNGEFLLSQSEEDSTGLRPAPESENGSGAGHIWLANAFVAFVLGASPLRAGIESLLFNQQLAGLMLIISLS